jgi:hypothetical protein
VFGVDLLAVYVHLPVVELGEVEEVLGFRLIVPRLAGTGLIQQ